MQFDSISAFINMGGYGFYVWMSYGTAFIAMAFLYYSSKVNHRKIKQQIAKRIKREDKLREVAKHRKQAAILP
tara:strand:+ start:33698 stop:33916 length:219 start_codon:yes stop_codon:yes gene_type:complete